MWWIFVLASLLSCVRNSPTSTTAAAGEFTLLTYNVAGLPQGISPSNPAKNIPLISPLLNRYDLVVVQEDFFYHQELESRAEHPHRSTPKAPKERFTSGDGLNRFSVFPFSRFQRLEWVSCSNASGNDCLARKGFSVAEHELAPGVRIDLYNLHLDSGSEPGDFQARSRQIDQLLNEINRRSAGKAVIVAGDMNLHLENRAQDLSMFQSLLQLAGLTDACQARSCPTELVDRVLFRGSTRLNLTVTEWKRDSDFVDENGQKLSDHFAVGVRFEWEGRSD